MRKRIFTLASIGLTIAIIVFVGCQRSKLSKNNSPEKNVQLVSEDTARSIAIHFNPSLFFQATNTANHSAFHSPLNGNNSIKNFTTIKDGNGHPAIYLFNFTNNNGFVFVSADYQMRPVIAFV